MSRLLVRDVMTPGVIVVAPYTPYKEIVQCLLRGQVSGVPVVNARGRVLGVVTELDLMHKVEFAGVERQVRASERRRQRVARAKAAAYTAQELMTSPAIVIAAEASLVAAAALMHLEGLKRLPVVDREGYLVGIVSRSDVLRAQHGAAPIDMEHHRPEARDGDRAGSALRPPVPERNARTLGGTPVA